MLISLKPNQSIIPPQSGIKQTFNKEAEGIRYWKARKVISFGEKLEEGSNLKQLK